MQERLESSALGRRVISSVLALTLATILVGNMPASNLKDRLLRAARPVLLATGLDQSWGVYAPNPPSATREVQARLSYPDGVTEVWRIPRGEPFLSRPYRNYRWLKFSEYINPDDLPELSSGLAEWLARTQRRGGQPPVMVTVVRRLRPLPPPGESGPKRPWEEEVVHILDRRPRAGAAAG